MFKLDRITLFFISLFILIGVSAVFSLKHNGLRVCEDTYPCYTPSMANISNKCGVKGHDEIWSTAIEKISKCLNTIYEQAYLDGKIDERKLILDQLKLGDEDKRSVGI